MCSPNPYRGPNPTFDEHRWIIHIRRLLEDDDLDLEPETPVSIFNTPKALLLTSPESYVPQLVALGPYHHHRPELYEMERHKLSAAKRFQKHLQGLKFQNLVHHLSRFEPQFRACYHKYLDFTGETLAWMMAVDSCFLLEFLRAFATREGTTETNRAGETGRKPGQRDAVVRDIVMLENQVPLLALRKTLELSSGSMNDADELIYAMMIAFCKEVSPLKTNQESPDDIGALKSAHILEILYRFTLQNFQGSPETALETEERDRIGGEKMNFRGIISRIKTGGLDWIQRLAISKAARFILTLPWKIISNLPGMMMIKQLKYLCFSEEKGPENEAREINKHPLMEEIAIPSVTELFNAGIKFSAVDSGISGIEFDRKTATLHLPSIVIDINTEVIMRNLVAYEACNDESGPLIFTRYTELMNGIIDDADDAKLLREEGVVVNHLKSDEEVAELWNGMSKSIRLTKVPLMDGVIGDVNSYYLGSWRGRVGRLLKRQFYGPWQCATFLAVVLLIFLVSLQAFCGLFGCARLFLHHTRIIGYLS